MMTDTQTILIVLFILAPFKQSGILNVRGEFGHKKIIRGVDESGQTHIIVLHQALLLMKNPI